MRPLQKSKAVFVSWILIKGVWRTSWRMFNVPQICCKLKDITTLTMKLTVIKVENEFVALLLNVARAFWTEFYEPRFIIGTLVCNDQLWSAEISKSLETKIFVSLKVKVTVSIFSREDSESRLMLEKVSCTNKNKPVKLVTLNNGVGIYLISLVYNYS